ncbi:TolB family protein [Kineosporia babensis]|uniref:WD40 repeat protein n=1 Tax=Kineosporia babensis TaxID=499548 RepID=A0A9X1NFC5_9ACTN|nr:hypothetical protein [Kineosporia babensis]MCD5312810.1 hypothetical protein [Kineosporia babensis]
MSVRNPIRIIPMLALLTGLSLGILGIPASASAASAPARASGVCPPDWLGTSHNQTPQVSANGRFVVFVGFGDGELGERVIFLRDLKRGRTTVVSDPDIHLFNFLPSISADGNRISYLSRDPLAHGNEAEIWVYDRDTKEHSFEGISFTQDVPALDKDGSRLTFTRLLGESTNRPLVFARDVDADLEWPVSVSTEGEPADAWAAEPEISGNGRWVVFRSYATNLTEDSPGADNKGAIYLRDLRTGVTSLIPDRNGQASSLERSGQDISPDGRYISYGDGEGSWVYDRRTGKVKLASADMGVADLGFKARKAMLLSGNGVYLRDLRTERQVRLDVRRNGSSDPVNPGWPGAMTPNGRYAVFYSQARDLDPSETAPEWNGNIYLRDVKAKKTHLVSTRDAGGSC